MNQARQMSEALGEARFSPISGRAKPISKAVFDFLDDLREMQEGSSDVVGAIGEAYRKWAGKDADRLRIAQKSLKFIGNSIDASLLDKP